MILKASLFLVLAVIFWLTWKTSSLGRVMARDRVRREYLQHQKHARWLFWSVLVAVVTVEAFVRLKGGLVLADKLLFVHISFSSLYLVGLILLNWPMSGLRRPTGHKIIAYTTLVCFAGVVATAVPVVWRL